MWLTNETKAFSEEIKMDMHSCTYASAPNVPVKTTAPELLAANSAYSKKSNIDQCFSLFKNSLGYIVKLVVER